MGQNAECWTTCYQTNSRQVKLAQVLVNSCHMKLGQNVFFTIARPSSNMGYVGSKIGHQVKSTEILVYPLETRFATRF